MEMVEPFHRENAILAPSGLQTGAEFDPPPKLSRRWPVPSAFIA